MNAAKLQEVIATGQLDDSLISLYGSDEQTLAVQRGRYISAVREYEAMFGGEGGLALYSVPGRTEIGGNHTDHNNGVVMAASVDLDIIAVVEQTSSNIARVCSRGFSGTDTVDLAQLIPVETEKGKSLSLIRGVAAGVHQRGGQLGGFNAYTSSNVLQGSGLSSSAAFEVCIADIFNNEFNHGRFSSLELSQIGQYAENRFFGKPSGLMDQLACAVGGAITIDFKDPAAPVMAKVSFGLAEAGYRLVITDTKGSHANLTDEYTAIRHEMEEVAAYFGVSVLREVDEAQVVAAIPQLREKVGDRAVLRALHFYAECKRVPMLAAAAAAGNMQKFLKLVLAGGHSSFEYNQNAYASTNPKEQGVSLGLALSQTILEGRGAWRLQGGGFAGTIQAFVPDDLLDAYVAQLEAVFGAKACHVLFVRREGAHRIL